MPLPSLMDGKRAEEHEEETAGRRNEETEKEKERETNDLS